MCASEVRCSPRWARRISSMALSCGAGRDIGALMMAGRANKLLPLPPLARAALARPRLSHVLVGYAPHTLMSIKVPASVAATLVSYGSSRLRRLENEPRHTGACRAPLRLAGAERPLFRSARHHNAGETPSGNDPAQRSVPVSPGCGDGRAKSFQGCRYRAKEGRAVREERFRARHGSDAPSSTEGRRICSACLGEDHALGQSSDPRESSAGGHGCRGKRESLHRFRQGARERGNSGPSSR